MIPTRRILAWQAAVLLALLAYMLAVGLLAAEPRLRLVAGLGGLAVLVLTVVAFRNWRAAFGSAARRLADRLEIAAATGEVDALPLAAPLLDPLPVAASRCLRALAAARAELDHARERAAQASEAQRRRLEAILRDLGEGLIVGDAAGRIVLYNDAALRVLGAPPALGLGRPISGVVSSLIVARQIELLGQRRSGAGPMVGEVFLCEAVEDGRLLHCRLALTADRPDEGFVLVFSAAGRAGAAAADAIVRLSAGALRGPLAAAQAAAEILSSHADLTPAERQRFVAAIGEEMRRLGAGVARLSAEARALAFARLVPAELRLVELLALVAAHLAPKRGRVSLEAVEPAVAIRADPALLALVLESLGHELPDGATELAFVASGQHEDVGLALEWRGPALPRERLEAWLDRPLGTGAGALTAREVLERHGAEPWAGRREGGCFVRLTLPQARPAVGPTRLPPRPELYDFELAAPAAGNLLARPLRQLAYVVLDTETTGLDPDGDDEIVQLAAVRIVNGRVLNGELFDTLVDPGRPIPPASTRFHGITDAMVRAAPSIDVVLPRFARFAADAVLVAHNAPFDLAFLARHAARTGVRLSAPAVDTLLLSVLLHGDQASHDLDSVLGRYGLVASDRHTAGGDSLATARLFVHMLGVLELRGITTLDELLRCSRAVLTARTGAGDRGS